ncbi:MAG: hypothetical protein JRD68_10515 [Deltaproteobacteria bacterium]|nr:hypothetical protein [Deltaproteobacteria bacterium]
MNRGILFSAIVLAVFGFFTLNASARQPEENKEAAKSQTGEPAETTKSAPVEEKRSASQEIVIRSIDKNLLSLNFIEVDIRKILSALAIKREINIATSKDVAGKISVHLYRVTLEEVLRAITLSGGYEYKKLDGLYFVYKPKEVRDPQPEKLIIKVLKLQYAEVDKVQEVLDAFPDIRMIKIHEPTKTIIIEDTRENIAKIENLIKYWDKKPRQVLIEAKILEISLTDDMSYGVDWGKVLGEVNIGAGGFSTAIMAGGGPVSAVPSTGAGIFANIITSAGTSRQFAAALDALQTRTRVETISTPTILAIHGKTARVQVGGKQGYKVTTVTGTGVATESIEFINTGTILEITPYIDDDRNVLLQVTPSINSARLEPGGIPVVSSTIVSTWLLAKDGETAFIGGLIQDTKTKNTEFVPCLGSITVLGKFFGQTEKTSGKSELVVLITPTIIDMESDQTPKDKIEKIDEMEKKLRQPPLSPYEELFD